MPSSLFGIFQQSPMNRMGSLPDVACDFEPGNIEADFFSARKEWPSVELRKLPSGELTFCYGKSQFFMGKSTISMAIFNCYVSSPEGMNHHHQPLHHYII